MMLQEEIEIDSFAGAGGVSEGMKMALGRSPAYAMNHDEVAVAIHAANHPETAHLTANIVKIDPRAVAPGKPIGLGWFSPDCTDHSKAKGGVPVRKHIRDLAWVVVHWAHHRRPRIIMVENVEEFEDWSPLIIGDDGELRRCPVSKGKTFRRFVAALRREGYAVEWRVLRCCDYSVPTIRKRLFIIARRDGEPIVWPQPTHGAPDSADVVAGDKLPYRTAAEIIDWTRLGYSIFLTREEARELRRAHGIVVQRPLKPNSMKRFAKGIDRYVLKSAKPFIVPITHAGDTRVHSIDESLRTQTTANRGEHALVTAEVAPFIAGIGSRAAQSGGKPSAGRPADAPLGGQTATKRGMHAVVAPLIVKNLHGDKQHYPVTEPTRTFMTGNHHLLVSAHLSRQFGASVGSDAEAPVGTDTAAVNKTAMVAAFLAQHNTERGGAVKAGRDAREPLGALTSIGNQQNVVAAFLAQNNYQEPGHDPRDPLSTIVQKGSTQAVVAAGLVNLRGTDRRDADTEAPTPTQSAQGNHLALVSMPVIDKYYSTGFPSQSAAEPLHTETQKPRFGVVEAMGAMPPLTEAQLNRARQVAAFLREHGYWDDREFVTIGPWLVIDILMRMLFIRERFNAHAFPPYYIIDIEINGRPITLEQQGRAVGNSVPPPMAAALISANYKPRMVAVEPPRRASEEFQLEAAE